MNRLKVHDYLQKRLVKCKLKNLRLTRTWSVPKKIETSRKLQRHFLSKENKKDLNPSDYEVILPKSKLKDLVQLSKEKNQLTKFLRDSPF